MAKTYTEKLQDHLDSNVKQITKFRLWREKKIEGLSADFTYKTGFADGVEIVGSLENPEVVKSKLPVCLLIHHPTHTKVCWQKTNCEQASILVCSRPKHLQGNPYLVLPCINKALEIIFNLQGYKSVYARAKEPLNDVGVRGEEWRDTLVKWKTRENSVRPIMIPRLMALWLRLVKWTIPAQYFGEDYDDTGIMVLSPNELKRLDESDLNDLDAVHGDAKRKWKFASFKK